MFHYRDEKSGRYYLTAGREPIAPRQEDPAFIRFARDRGAARGLWHEGGAPSEDFLNLAGLNWPVEPREVFVTSRNTLMGIDAVPNYRALVRPDCDQVMSIVSRAYQWAENAWVVDAMVDFCSPYAGHQPMVAAASHGRDAEKSIFAARVLQWERTHVCLIAYNTHGGQGALRFELVEVDRQTGSVYALENRNATLSIPHTGDVVKRLRSASQTWREDTFIARYLAETQPQWSRAYDSLWTPRHSEALIRHLWGEAPAREKETREGFVITTSEAAGRHPAYHLLPRLRGITDAANAYRQTCEWIDYESEACERGDFTKDRDERLALGAGVGFKRKAWRWILDNT